MRRCWAGFMALLVARAVAAGDDLPPLLPPTDTPRVAEPAPSRPPLFLPSAEEAPTRRRPPSAGATGREPRPIVLESTPAPRTAARPSGPSSAAPGRAPRPRFFGLLPAERPGDRAPSAPADSIQVEPRVDPAADEALRRRLEGEIRAAVGDRVRAVQVRVAGREVQVRARVNRFWQRRGVQ